MPYTVLNKDLTATNQPLWSPFPLRCPLIILTLGIAITGCSQARNNPPGGFTADASGPADRSQPVGFDQPQEKKWWEWWKPDPPEPVYKSAALRRAIAANRSSQTKWWEWWKPSQPDPSDPQYVAKQKAWMEYQQKKQLEEFARLRNSHEKRMAELRKNNPSGFEKSTGIPDSFQRTWR